MTRHPSRKDMAPLADQLGPEDGIDPRLIRPDLSGRTIRRNTLQLCAQVARTLGEALAGCADEVLRDLHIVGVVPAAGGGRLLVTLARSVSAMPHPDDLIEQRLARAHGLLRSEVAAAVNRRRTPELIFRVVGAEMG
jgi:ribosome-binding factor A